MNKRVLITGAGGFMGSHVMRHLLVNTDWHLVLLDSFRHRGKTDRIRVQLEGQDNSRVTVLTHDLRAPISTQLANKIGHIDYILNIASESHVDRSITDPREFIENNVSLVLTMLEYMRTFRVPLKFIQISTDEVFGPAPEHYAHHEYNEPHLPSNPYSASKAAQEDICYSYWRTYGLPIIITNTMNIFGELQDPEKFIPMTIKKILAGDTVSIHASDEGTIGSRFYLHARNQADALLFILNNIEPTLYSPEEDITRYNVVGEVEIDNRTMAKMIARFMGKTLKYKLVDFHSSRPGHDLRYALDGTLLALEGWKAPYGFEDSLKKTIEWTLKHEEWL